VSHRFRTDLVELHAQEVHVWYICTDSLTDPEVIEEFRLNLSDEELRRWQRFAFEEGRRQFLISHGFVRAVLSRYVAIHPSHWRFIPDHQGKPQAHLPPQAAPPHRSTLCFNLTHTRGLAACCVAWDREVGIDAEDWERQGRELSELLIRRCLSAVEQACFELLHPSERKRGFFDYWTLKEAYLKARGVGLSLPLEEITFHWPSGVPHDEEVAVSFGPAINDHSHTWQFARFTPTERHRIALAARRPAGPDVSVILHEFTS
jgi:4'-phosphopantetheinyl transferase